MEYHLSKKKNWTYMGKSEFSVLSGFSLCTNTAHCILGDKGNHSNFLAL